ncbi:hypothetical protein HYQ44_000487 [Verticillium longisporum]|nr:hypothetical protein HYQ44_000487 [Verticillium longisporum]
MLGSVSSQAVLSRFFFLSFLDSLTDEKFAGSSAGSSTGCGVSCEGTTSSMVLSATSSTLGSLEAGTGSWTSWG